MMEAGEKLDCVFASGSSQGRNVGKDWIATPQAARDDAEWLRTMAPSPTAHRNGDEWKVNGRCAAITEERPD